MTNFSIKILICFTLSFVANSYSQTYLEYYSTINEAEISTLDKNYAKSDSLYEVAFSLVDKPFQEDYFLSALNAEKLEDFDKVNNYLVKGIKNGLTLNRIKKSELKKFKRGPQYKILKKEYKRLHGLHLKSLNLDLRNEIIEMVKKDQKARIPILGGWKQMKKTDSYNYNRLLEIIKENNDKWPGFSTIGEIVTENKYSVADNIVLMPLHFKSDWTLVLEPYMRQAVFDGEMYPYQYARIIDYKFLDGTETVEKSNGNKDFLLCLKYGTYSNVPICDCEKAEMERKKIGFEPLDDFYRKIKYEYHCKK